MTRPFDFDVSKYPPLPQLRGLFVTGTDTGVGKTLVAGAIARRLRQLGRCVEVFKPVATGCRRDRLGLVSADAEFLAACAESRRTLAEIVPLRYASACSPNVAAKREHREIDLPAMFEAYARLAGPAEAPPARATKEADPVVIVEGVGGLLCPISDDFWVIHFAKMTRLPLVIVARAGLGTVNHTLLTLHAARSAGLGVAGVVMNGYLLEPPYDSPRPGGQEPAGDIDIAMFTNPQEIAQRGKVDVLAVVPQEKHNSVEQATIGPDTQFVISRTPWEELMR